MTRVEELAEGLPPDIFNACMESVSVDGLGETYRFTSVPPRIPDELYKRLANSIIRLKGARQKKQADGSPNPEYNAAVDNATALPFVPFQPHKLMKWKGKSGHSGKAGNTGVRTGKILEGGQVVVEEAKKRPQADKEKQKLG